MLAAKINNKLRSEAYRKILKMPISWFDRSENTSGALVSKLSVDCYQIEDMIALDFCFALQNVSTMISGLAIAFVFDWRTALVGFAFSPLLVMANVLSMSFVSSGTANNADIAYRESAQLAM
jgi:ATP-binding cassette subfamily B (MDR/TAP) protein 1